MKVFNYLSALSAKVSLLLLFLVSCGESGLTEKIVVSGVTTKNSYYSPDSFFSSETVDKTFTDNGLNFWFFLEPSELNNDEQKLSKKISAVTRRFGKNDRKYFQKMSEISEVSNSEIKNSTVLFFTPDRNSSNIPVQVREIEPVLYFNTEQISYKGEIKSHFDNYYEHLNRGFIAGVSVEAEILGPEWSVRNPVRMNVITEGADTDLINEAVLNRRTYISFEPDTLIDFKINSEMIGGVIESKESVFNYSINIKSAKSNIGNVKLISNNNNIIRQFHNVNSKTFSNKSSVELKDQFNFLMLKVYFENGNIAYTTPIWIVKSRGIVLNKPEFNIIDKRISVDKVINVNIENITHETMSNVEVKVFSKDGAVLSQTKTSLRGREIKNMSLVLNITGTEEEKVSLKVYNNDLYVCSTEVTVKNTDIKRVLIDSYHNNLYSDSMNILKSEFERKGYIADYADNYSYFTDAVLQQYDLLIMTSPTVIKESARDEIHLLYALHRYVYNGGNILLAGTDDERAKFSIVYLNRILRILYSPVSFRYNDRVGVYPIFDETDHFSSKYTPVFKLFNESVIKSPEIKNIYLRSPVEIMAVSSAGEVPIGAAYNTIPAVRFSETTDIENRRITSRNYLSPVTINRFGKGNVAVMAGINFSDYDINNLDNKKWILEFIDYMILK